MEATFGHDAGTGVGTEGGAVERSRETSSRHVARHKRIASQFIDTDMQLLREYDPSFEKPSLDVDTLLKGTGSDLGALSDGGSSDLMELMKQATDAELLDFQHMKQLHAAPSEYCKEVQVLESRVNGSHAPRLRSLMFKVTPGPQAIVKCSRTFKPASPAAACGCTQDMCCVPDPTYFSDPLVLRMLVALPVFEALAQRPASSLLLVGMGSGMLATFCRQFFPDVRVHGVEVDPAVVRASTQFLGLCLDERVTAEVADAKAYFESHVKNGSAVAGATFDIIVLDASTRHHVPPHLENIEFLRQVRALLEPKHGLLVARAFMAGHDSMRWIEQMVTVFSGVLEWEMWMAVSKLMFCSPGELDFDQAAVVRRVKELVVAKQLPPSLLSAVHGAAQAGNGAFLQDSRRSLEQGKSESLFMGSLEAGMESQETTTTLNSDIWT